MRPLLLLVAVGASLGGALLACGGDAQESQDTAQPVCDTALPVTWSNWGEGFVLTHCSGCHAETALDRHGAPEGLFFDTENQVLEFAATLLRMVVDEESMPPAGGVRQEEMVLLEAWLGCLVP